MPESDRRKRIGSDPRLLWRESSLLADPRPDIMGVAPVWDGQKAVVVVRFLGQRGSEIRKPSTSPGLAMPRSAA